MHLNIRAMKEISRGDPRTVQGDGTATASPVRRRPPEISLPSFPLNGSGPVGGDG